MVFRWAALAAFLLFSLPQLSFAAESSADVSASPALKEQARTEVLGDRATAIPRQQAYTIGHGDVLAVSIYGEGSMAVFPVAGTSRQGSGDAPRVDGGGVRVMMDGRISLRHIGDVEVVGMTLTELADYLKKLYSVIYDEPIVTTTLVQSNSQRYTMMGNVANPGIFFLDYPITVVQAVARSGGFSEWASREITVVRKELGPGDKKLFTDNTLRLDYEDFLTGEGLTTDVQLRSGDIVIVD